MPPALIVGDAPPRIFWFGFSIRRELVYVEALIPQVSIERRDEGVGHWFPGRMESSCMPRRGAVL